jgi:YVTN family beta-propeller protein
MAMLQGTGRRIVLPCLMFALLLLSACSEDTVGPPEIVIPGPNEPIVYSKHIEPIFYRSCGGEGCHLNEGVGKVAHGAGGDLELDTWGAVMSGSEHGAVVVPYWSSKSHLLFHINSDTTIAPIASPHMPKEGDTLPGEQILLIKRWIDEGAKNDNGDVAMAGETLPRIFVTAQAEDKLTAIDLQQQLVMRYIPVGERPDKTTPPEAPHNITLSPDGRYLYVNLIATGMVEKYDARTFQKLGQVQVGVSPAQIVVTGDGATLYVSNFDLSPQEQRFINRVDAASMQVTGVIDEVGRAPHGLTLSRDEHYLYTMNAGGDDIAEIDLLKPVPEVTRRIPIVPGSALPPGQQTIHEPYQSVLSSDGAMLFVTCRKSGQVRVVDLAQGKVVDSITVGARPLILNITPDGREIWVPNQASDNVSIIDVATRAVVATISNINKQPHAVAFKANSSVAYISCENQNGEAHHPTTGSRIPGKVYPVVVATRFVGEPVEVGAFAAGIVVGK